VSWEFNEAILEPGHKAPRLVLSDWVRSEATRAINWGAKHEWF